MIAGQYSQLKRVVFSTTQTNCMEPTYMFKLVLHRFCWSPIVEILSAVVYIAVSDVIGSLRLIQPLYMMML